MGRKDKQPTIQEMEQLRVEGDVTEQEMLRDDVNPNYYATDDEKFLKLMEEEDVLRPLRPLASRLMRLTKISEKDKESLDNEIDLIVGTLEMDMDEDDYDNGEWAMLNSAALVLKTSNNDSVKGFKLDMITRIRKELRLQREEVKNKRWL